MHIFYVEGVAYISVLPRGWHVRVCVFPVWRVVCAYVSCLEGGMCACVCFLCIGKMLGTRFFEELNPEGMTYIITEV